MDPFNVLSAIRAVTAGAVLGGLWLVAASQADASPIRTIDFTASGPTVETGDPFGKLGLPGVVQTVIGTIVIDTSKAPIRATESHASGTVFEAEDTLYGYESFTVRVGAVELNGAPSIPTSLREQIRVLDGIGSSRADEFRISSRTD